MAQVIAERYQVLEERGKGGMGTVYKGLDTRDNVDVAIKLLHPQMADPAMIERFKREGEALRELNHPNIVKMLDAVEQDEKHYLIMEYVDGGDLSHLLEDSNLSIERCITMALDLADALTRAHKLNIIHRDLKPANIMLADDGTLRLTDFGVAYMARKERVTQSNSMVGTIDYMPPETFEQKPADERADIWAFGVILYEMLTCQRPFSGETIIQVIQEIVSESVPDLEEFRPDAPIPLVDLIYRMLAKDPQQRIPSVRIVGAELEAILKGHEVDSSFHAISDSSLGIVADSPRFDTPALASSEIRHNLPAEVSAFVGRKDELSEIARLLADTGSRLITILAPGGMGKTRLALESARQNMLNYADGVFFVELAPLESSNDIVSTIADAVKFQFYAGGEPKDQLLDYLRNQNMLLVMDNYEHLLDGAKLVGEILKAADGVTVLATSRAKLNLTAETLYTISGMEFPDWETPEDALQYSAVKLFMQSARRVRPDFELEQDDLTYVARICRLVSGMPLGIELAAAWLEMLSPHEVADELTQSSDFLETDNVDLPERQRSLRAVFDYSWDLLTEKERTILMKLAVFRESFSRSAAQKVTGAGLRDLMTLVNKSLLQRDPETGAYAIHKLLQQYAEERLDESGEAQDVRDAHSAYFLVALAEREDELNGADGLKFLADIEDSFEDVRAAIFWSAQNGHYEYINHALHTIWVYFLMRSKGHIAMPFFDQLTSILRQQTQSPERDNTLGYTLHRQIRFTLMTGQNKRREDLAEDGFALINDSAPAFILAYQEHVKGEVQPRGTRKSQRPYFERALEMYREIGNFWGEVNALTDISGSYWFEDWQEAEKYIQQAYSMLNSRGNQTFIAFVTMNYASVAIQSNFERFEEAKAYYHEARDYAQALGMIHLVGMITRNLAVSIYFLGNREQESIQYFTDARKYFREVGDLAFVAWTSMDIGNMYRDLGDFERAEEYMDEAFKFVSQTQSRGRWFMIKDSQIYLYCLRGQYDKVKQAVEQFMDKVRESEEDTGLPYGYLTVGVAECLSGNYQNAKHQLEKGIERAEGFDDVLGMLRHFYALTLHYLDENQAAQEINALAVDFFRNHSQDPNSPAEHLPVALAAKTLIMCKSGQYTAVKNDIVEALERVHQRPNVWLYGVIFHAFAIWLNAAGHKEKATELASFIVSEERFAHYSRRDTQALYDALANDYPEAIERGKNAELNTWIETLLSEFGQVEE